MSALGGANIVRLARSEVRQRLASLELPFDEFLDETPEPCLKVSLVKLLQWLPNIGRNRARKIMEIIWADEPQRISSDMRIGDLTGRDKCRLFDLVNPHLEEYRRTYLPQAA